MEQIRYNKILVNEISDIQPTDKDAKEEGIRSPPPFHRKDEYHQRQKDETESKVDIKRDVLHRKFYLCCSNNQSCTPSMP